MHEIAQISASNETGSNNSKIDTKRECDRIGELLSQSDEERGYALNKEEKNYLKNLFNQAKEYIAKKLDKNNASNLYDSPIKPDGDDPYKKNNDNNNESNVKEAKDSDGYEPVNPDSDPDDIKDDQSSDDKNNKTADKKFIGDDGKMYVKKPDGSVYDLQG